MMRKHRKFPRIISLALIGLMCVLPGWISSAAVAGQATSSLDNTGNTDPLATWTARTFAMHISDVSFGNNVYVAVGSDKRDTNAGAMLVSNDTAGSEWTQVTTDVPPLNAVTFGNGLFVAVGENGAIYHSADGSTWTPSNSGTTEELFGVAYGNGVFIAVGSRSIGTEHMLVSSDGITWSRVTSVDILYPLYDVTFTNGVFIATGWAGVIYYSYDGAKWTGRSSHSASLQGSAYGNGRYVVVGISGSIASSGNLKKWHSESSSTFEDLNGVAFGNNTFVAVGENGAIVTSSDGRAWSLSSFRTPDTFSSIQFVNGMFLAAGENGLVATSPDGTVWTTRTPAADSRLVNVTFANNVFVAVGNHGTVLTSADGVNWTSQLAIENPTIRYWTALTGIAYGNETLVAVAQGLALTSDDNGVTWSEHSPVVSSYLTDLEFGNNLFVAVGFSGTIIYSIDGITWSVADSGTLADLHQITYTGTQFIASGQFGKILTSSDGITWAIRSGGLGYHDIYAGAAYGNGASVVGGTNGMVVTSSGEVYWTERDFVTLASINEIAHENNTFVTVGDGGTIASSHDGRSGWLQQRSEVGTRLTSIAYGNNTFVAVGELDADNSVQETGIVLQSSALVPVDPPETVSEMILDQTALDFGKVKRDTSFSRSITITNLWTGNLEVETAIAGTHAGEYAVTGSNCGTWISVAPDSSCTVDITFTPTGPFARSATLTLTTNDPNNPAVDVSLSGIGLQPIISVTPPSLNLGDVQTGFVSYRSLYVGNTGNDVLTVTLTVTGADADQFQLSGRCVPEGNIRGDDECWLFVFFQPTSPGDKSASVEIVSNDPEQLLVTVPLAGSGI